MSFEDLFDPKKEIHNLQVDIENLEQNIQDYKGMTNILQKQRQTLTFLLKEASYYMAEFKEAMTEEDFKKCEKAADKNYEDWVKEEMEIDKVSVDVTLKP